MFEEIAPKPAPSKLDDLLDRFNARRINETDTEEIPEAGTEGNPWIGFEYVTNGQKKFHAFSGAERRTLRRRSERAEAADQARGQRAYNRNQRRQEFDKGTIRQQARILRGEVQVSPDMMANLQNAIMQQHRILERAETADERREARANRRAERLRTRQMIRIHENRARHSDFVAAFGPDYGSSTLD